MIFKIEVGKQKTEEQFFKSENTKLTIRAFKATIVGLRLWLDNGAGTRENFLVFNNRDLECDISEYGIIWFEYSYADREYEIEVFVK